MYMLLYTHQGRAKLTKLRHLMVDHQLFVVSNWDGLWTYGSMYSALWGQGRTFFSRSASSGDSRSNTNYWPVHSCKVDCGSTVKQPLLRMKFIYNGFHDGQQLSSQDFLKLNVPLWWSSCTKHSLSVGCTTRPNVHSVPLSVPCPFGCAATPSDTSLVLNGSGSGQSFTIVTRWAHG